MIMRLGSTFILIFHYFILSHAFALDRISFGEGENEKVEFGEMPKISINDIESVQLKCEAILKVSRSIFYSLIPTNKGFCGFYRIRYNSYELGMVLLDKNLNFCKDYGSVIGGEDPRSFKHGPFWYITDNTMNNNKIIKILNNGNELKFRLQYCRDNGDANYSDGKNPTYFSYNNRLFQIKWFYPFELYCFNKSLQNIELVHKHLQPIDDKYRGGTPGYATDKDGEFIGFGHYTILENNILKHYPFIWKFNIHTLKLTTKLFCDLVNSCNILDPVCIIEIEDNFYLITAESENSWFEDQDYLTKLWRIVKKD